MKSIQKGSFCEGMTTGPRNCPVIASECDGTAVRQLNAIMAGDVGLSKQVFLVTDSEL
jgi:coenzyme F420-reducing hydrogenase gamma subunit